MREAIGSPTSVAERPVGQWFCVHDVVPMRRLTVDSAYIIAPQHNNRCTGDKDNMLTAHRPAGGETPSTGVMDIKRLCPVSP